VWLYTRNAYDWTARLQAIAAGAVRIKAKRQSLANDSAMAKGERRKVEADLGPVQHLATLLGASDQDVLFQHPVSIDSKPSAASRIIFQNHERRGDAPRRGTA
jgi:hypothetical protein